MTRRTTSVRRLRNDSRIKKDERKDLISVLREWLSVDDVFFGMVLAKPGSVPGWLSNLLGASKLPLTLCDTKSLGHFCSPREWDEGDFISN